MHGPRPGERVVVGMSGGVDSSVAAALLVERGCEVIGISMRLWGGASTNGCCSVDDFLDARRVAAQLGIRYYVMDFRELFERHVVDPFVDDYLAGRTPNPCARCNQFVKFDALWQRARALGASWMATGHYARTEVDATTGAARLLASPDEDKDQSYFLFAISPALLQHTAFPVGHMTKAEVREVAARLDLDVATKRESQEICFVAKGRYSDFVRQRSGRPLSQDGSIVDGEGRSLGRHRGVHEFTIGQRRGLSVAHPEPLYVTGIDARTNTVTVGPKEATWVKGLEANDANWLSERPPVRRRVEVKIRSRAAAVPAELTACRPSGFALRAAEPLPAVTPGQAAVLYDGQRVLGGGWIVASIAEEV